MTRPKHVVGSCDCCHKTAEELSLQFSAAWWWLCPECVPGAIDLNAIFKLKNRGAASIPVPPKESE